MRASGPFTAGDWVRHLASAKGRRLRGQVACEAIRAEDGELDGGAIRLLADHVRAFAMQVLDSCGDGTIETVGPAFVAEIGAVGSNGVALAAAMDRPGRTNDFFSRVASTDAANCGADDAPPPWVVITARVLWLDWVNLSNSDRPLQPPAVARLLVHDLLPAAHTVVHESPNDDKSLQGRAGSQAAQGVGVDFQEPDGALLALPCLRSIHGQRLLRALVREGHRGVLQGRSDPHIVRLGINMSDVAESLGFSRNDRAALRAIFDAGRGHWRAGGFDIGVLWTWSATRIKGTRGSVPVFTLGDALLPNFVHELKRRSVGSGRRSVEARRLVPELRFDPPLVGRRNSWGAVWMLHSLILVEFVDQSVEFHESGCVLIAPSRWQTLALRAGLPLNVLTRVQAAYLTGHGTAPPLLAKVGAAGWRLGPDHEPEERFIREGGRVRIEAKRRRARRKPHARKTPARP